MRYHEEQHLLGAGSPPGLDTEVSREGIVQGHAYAILRCVEVKDHRGRHQLLKLRNPWGHGEWNGAWCDDDEDSWTKRMRCVMAHAGLCVLVKHTFVTVVRVLSLSLSTTQGEAQPSRHG